MEDWKEELCHYGIQGQKWGIRRYQNEDGTLTEAGKKRLSKNKEKIINNINKIYDKQNLKNEKKKNKMDKKEKYAKSAVLQEIINRNEQNRADKTNFINNIKNITEYKDIRKQDRRDAMWGGQEWMEWNISNLTTPLSQINERQMQRGMRSAMNFTLNSTLARMTPDKAYEYLRRKHISSSSYGSGYGAGYGAGVASRSNIN